MKTAFTYPSLHEIRDARARIDNLVHRTPILTSSSIDNLAGCSLFFKCENLQKVGAFKARGASNAVLKLPPEQMVAGVATHSSGNHAAALARAATVAGVKSYIVMPSTSPAIKKLAVREYGGEIHLCEPTLEARESMLADIVEKTGATFIHPYDNADVIEGQATCALEIWEEEISLNALLTPVGGGGLLGGTALSTHYLSPSCLVFGAEPTGADDAYRSFNAGQRIPMKNPNTIADGLLTSLGEKNWALIRDFVEDILPVSDEEIIASMRLVYERLKMVIEPSCAVPLAAVLRNREIFAGKRVGIILSGGNVDLAKLPF